MEIGHASRRRGVPARDRHHARAGLVDGAVVRPQRGSRIGTHAAVLEEKFPKEFGTWEYVQELASDPKQLERAGAVGHVSRLYRDTATNVKVSAFVVCATPHNASGHTPDRCYPGAGFEIRGVGASAEHSAAGWPHGGNIHRHVSQDRPDAPCVLDVRRRRHMDRRRSPASNSPDVVPCTSSTPSSTKPVSETAKHGHLR